MAVVILPLFLLLLLPFAAAQGPWQFCGTGGTYTSNSIYQANLKLLSSTLPRKAASNTTLFATDTIGNLPDIIFALALCRGDSNASACEGCLATAFQDGQQLCPHSRDASIYYHSCMLRFSNTNFLPTMVDQSWKTVETSHNFNTSIDSNSTRQLLFTLINSTAQSAANSSRRFMTSRLDVRSFPTVYCLMQCTPDLSTGDCAFCFGGVSRLMFWYLNGPRVNLVMGTRCNMRYEIYQFFRGDPMMRITAAVAPPVGGRTVEQNKRNSHKRVMWIIVAAAPLLTILLCSICCVVRKRRQRRGMVNLYNQGATQRPGEEDAMVLRLEEKGSKLTLFFLSEILHATCNFSEENRLGQGGFGPVYKGKLPDGIEIAVKRLASHSGQGFMEFKNEVELVAKLQHNNLVKLLGCCIQGDEKLLVYEYLQNKSLDFFIFDGNRKAYVDWTKRRVIIEGIAQGLLYLHKHSRLRIIHRDLKASNILLDEDMNPKISDFGLAKIFRSIDTEGRTKRIVGTYGYMSPEYASKGIYSFKSDVFSFGVLLLEILSGKRNYGFHQHEEFFDLLGYSWQLWKGGRHLELLEESIATEIHIKDAQRYINIALMCVQDHTNDRPTMSKVVAMLSSESVILPEPNQPAYFNLRVSKVGDSPSVVALCSNNDVTITAEPYGR